MDPARNDAELVFQAEARRTLACSPALAWALMADSNRWDRVVGCNPTTYTYDLLREGEPRSRARVGHTQQFGKELTWTEAGEWVEGRFMWGERRYLRGGVRRAGFRFTFADDAGGTAVGAEAYVVCAERAAATAGMLREHFQSTLERYLDAMAALLPRLAAAEAEPPVGEPPVSTARRLLLGAPADELVAGPRTPPSEADLQFHLVRFAETPVDEAVRDRLVDLLRSRSDEELAALRPFEIARAWGLSRRRVARAFLFAARSGLLDLRWHLVCPTCRVAAQTRGSVGEIGRVEHCRDCDVDFQVDFAANVEAVFAVNPAIRPVAPQVYCGGSPWFRPHVLAVLGAEAGGTRTTTARLPVGALVVRTLDNGRRASITLDGAPRELHLRVTDDGIVPAATYVGDDPGETVVLVENEGTAHVTVLIERTGQHADVALGSYVVTMPDFRDLFATEAPATGVDLSVGALTILFSDLVGSTAMYERLGDARAFALVEEHFRDVQRILDEHDGTLVKTMGDAVMASFRSPAQALAAALAMVPRVEAAGRAHGVDGLSLKIGLHHGACLAVRANGRLDFFGTTVNLAARLQGAARGGQVVLLAELLDHPEVARVFTERNVPSALRTASIPGLRDEQRLVLLDAR